MAGRIDLKILNNDSAPGIDRREMVRRLLGGMGAGFALPAIASSHPIHKHLGDAAALAEAEAKAAAAEWTPEFLDSHQNETLIVLAERIVPNSTKAQVNRFVDLLLTVDSSENQKKFISSLSAFEAESLGRHARPFKDLTEEQQIQILTAASTEKSGRPEGKGDWSWFDVPAKEAGEPPRVTLRDHFENIKGWVVGAFYSSEIGMRELGWTGQVAWDSFPGCQHPEGHH